MTETSEIERVVATETHVEAPASFKQQLLLFIIAGLVILVDHLSKRYIEDWLPLNQSWAPWPDYAHFFQLTHVANRGAAFGFFQGGSLFFTIAAIVVAVIIIFYNFSLPSGHRLLRLALGLQLGGALGNVIDRFRLGHVTDFFDFGPWPVFNVADAAIVSGVAILAWLMFKEERDEARSQPDDEEAWAPPEA